MRKLFIAAALLALVTVSCQKNQIEEDTTSFEEIDQSIIEQIAALGFNTGDVKKIDEGYLVEGDIILTSENLNGATGENHELVIGNTEHYRTNNTVTSLPRNITVRVNSSLPARYVTATNAAIARYNALGLRITFSRVTSGGNIVINGVYTSSYLASAGFPTSSGNPYNNINVSRTYLDTWNANTLTTIIAHEIGHAIGFRHSDYMDRSYSCGGSYYNEGSAGVGAVHIPGTPTGAAAGSWMLSCIGNGTNRPFTSADQTALHYVY